MLGRVGCRRETDALLLLNIRGAPLSKVPFCPVSRDALDFTYGAIPAAVSRLECAHGLFLQTEKYFRTD